jgi:hypothetical protein
MPQEPWKRAAQLQRAVPPDARAPLERPQDLSRQRRARYGWFWLAALALLSAAAWYFWPQLSMIVRSNPAAQQAASAISGTKDLELPRLTAESLDAGLGLELVMFGDPGKIVNRSQSMEVDWKIVPTGGATSRMTATGLNVYSDKHGISGWRMDVPLLFRTEAWKPWLRELREAGIDPELLLQPAGQEFVATLEGSLSVQTTEGWKSSVYEIHYVDGKLREIKAGVRLGAGAAPAPENVDKSTPVTSF